MSYSRPIALTAIAAALAAILWADWRSNGSSPPPTRSKAADRVALALPQGETEYRSTLETGSETQPRSGVTANADTGTPKTWPLTQPSVAAASTTPTTGSGPAPDISAARDFEEIVRRPLFSLTRRPAAPPPPVTKPPKRAIKLVPPRQPPFDAKLVGIISSNGDKRAILKLQGSNKTLNAGLGQAVDGWKLDRISAASVRVRHKNWTRELKLFAR